jgi:tetratricopeptide (TPR) repeat protein
MSLSLVEPKRLIAPIELETMEPAALANMSLGELFGVTAPSSTPSFVVQARELAVGHPESAIAFARLAQAEQTIGNYDDAVAAARLVLDLLRRTPDASALIGAARVLASSDLFEEAEAALAGSTLEGPLAVFHASIAARRGAFPEALDRLSGVVLPEAFALSGWIALQSRDYPVAIRLFRESLRHGEPSPSVLTNLGYAHAALGSRARAIRETKEARALSPASRLIRFNLVAYLVSGGEFEEALAELAALREFHPHDIDLSFAEADVHLLSEDISRAHRVLQRARTNLWAYASRVEQAQLDANLAVLKWRVGSLKKGDAASAVLDALESVEFSSLEIASLLPQLLNRPADLPRLDRVIQRLAGVSENPLYRLRVHRHLLRHEFETASEIAAAWARDQIFDVGAASTAAYLLTEAKGDWESAIEIGQPALARMPGFPMLRNNLAYALIQAGRTHEARDLLQGHEESVHLKATRALMALAGGDIEQGMAGYRSAYELALEQQNRELALLVIIFEALALHGAGSGAEIDSLPWKETLKDLPSDWIDDPFMALMKARLEREGILWERITAS